MSAAVIDLTGIPDSPPKGPNPPAAHKKRKRKAKKKQASSKVKKKTKKPKKKPLHPCCDEKGAPECAVCLQSGDERGAHTMVYLRHLGGGGHCLCTACWAGTNYAWMQGAINPSPHHATGAMVGQGSPHGLSADGSPYPNPTRLCECMRCKPAQLGRPACPLCRQIVVAEENVNCNPVSGGGIRRVERLLGKRFPALRRQRNNYLLLRR